MLAASKYNIGKLNNQSKILNATLNNVKLKQVTDLRYLGVHPDHSLTWDIQVLKLCNIISSKLYLLNSLSKYIDKDTLLALYNYIILPNIDYAVSVWGYCSQKNRALIKRLQHRASRIIMRNFDYIDTRGEDLMKQLGMQSLETRRDYFTAIMMYKIINETAPNRLIDSINHMKDIHGIQTRSSASNDVQIPEVKYEIFRNSFKYQGSILWNSLPPQLRSAKTVHSFKTMYKMLYFKT